MLRSTFIIFSLILLFTSCKSNKSGDIDPNPEIEDGVLTDDQVRMIELLDIDSIIRIDDLQFDDLSSMGKFLRSYDPSLYSKNQRTAETSDISGTFSFQRNLFIVRMIANGLILTNREAHTFPSEGENKPAQQGLAYSFGSKNHNARRKPTQGTCNRESEIYGLDCSGLIYQIATQSGLKIISDPSFCNVSYLQDTLKWSEAFQKSSEFNNLKMVSPIGGYTEIRSGDIIAWDNSHIGIAIPGNKIIHSSGYANAPSTGDCSANFRKGPRINTITEGFMNEFNGGRFTILRVEPACKENLPLTVIFDYNKRHRKYQNPYVWNWLTVRIVGGQHPYSGFSQDVTSGSGTFTTDTQKWYCNNIIYNGGWRWEGNSSGPGNGRHRVKVTDNRGATIDTTFYLY